MHPHQHPDAIPAKILHQQIQRGQAQQRQRRTRSGRDGHAGQADGDDLEEEEDEFPRLERFRVLEVGVVGRGKRWGFEDEGGWGGDGGGGVGGVQDEAAAGTDGGVGVGAVVIVIVAGGNGIAVGMAERRESEFGGEGRGAERAGGWFRAGGFGCGTTAWRGIGREDAGIGPHVIEEVAGGAGSTFGDFVEAGAGLDAVEDFFGRWSAGGIEG